MLGYGHPKKYLYSDVELKMDCSLSLNKYGCLYIYIDVMYVSLYLLDTINRVVVKVIGGYRSSTGVCIF